MTPYLKKYFNLRLGLIGALVTGGIVWYINKNESLDLAFFAASKQAVYTFFFGGFFTRLCENICLQFENLALGVLVSTIVVSLLTLSIIFFIHNLKGTPKPIESTLAMAVIVPPGFALTAYHKRRKKV
ncbi:MAG: hypothetical protein AAF363_06745 [Bacteroidota bacterium]